MSRDIRTYEVETTNDYVLSIHEVECNTISLNGKKRDENEIGIFISGNSKSAPFVVAELVTFTKEEAIKVADTIIKFASDK